MFLFSYFNVHLKVLPGGFIRAYVIAHCYAKVIPHPAVFLILIYIRNVGGSSCNSGDGTDHRVQSLMFMMMR
jgi:hypothetical protein